MHPVTVMRRRPNGTPLSSAIDTGGAMFVEAPSRGIRVPILSYSKDDRQLNVFTCPVSAIPPAVWQLLELWLTCRSLRALPLPGGVLDQPEIVRSSFLMFESERRLMERESLDAQAEKAASGGKTARR